jgi:CDP-diacylglycerol---glycerol-3-phosphate 3-phosphatidyltransferase
VTSINLPNALTVVRVLLVPVLVVALTVEGGDALAATVFALASFTDFLDGWLARRRGTVTTFGKVMDPIADKLMVAAALIALVSLERVAAWIVLVIIAREFAVSGLRAAAGQQGVVIEASSLGKAKTLVQVATIFLLIIAPDPHAVWMQVLVYATVAITLGSGVDYFLSYRRRMDEAGVDSTLRPDRPG